MNNWKRQVVRFLIACLIFIWCYWLSACAATNNKPSTSGAAATTHVAAAHGAVQQAQASNAQARQINESMAGNLDRAERKNVLVRRWFELQNGK